MRIIFIYFFLFLPLPLLAQLKATLTFSQALARDWKQGETQRCVAISYNFPMFVG
jgi:hypothetical protein